MGQVLAQSGQKFLELSGYISLYCYSFSQVALFFDQLGNFCPVLVIFSLKMAKRLKIFRRVLLLTICLASRIGKMAQILAFKKWDGGIN